MSSKKRSRARCGLRVWRSGVVEKADVVSWRNDPEGRNKFLVLRTYLFYCLRRKSLPRLFLCRFAEFFFLQFTLPP